MQLWVVDSGAAYCHRYHIGITLALTQTAIMPTRIGDSDRPFEGLMKTIYYHHDHSEFIYNKSASTWRALPYFSCYVEH